MADPQVIIEEVKSMCFSDSPSLGAPVLGAEACLDAFEEVCFLHLLENQRTKALNPLSCLEQSLQGGGALGCWRGECWPVSLLCSGS